jgi:hypothetical protein
MMRCGISAVFNSFSFAVELGLRCGKRSSENGELPVGFQSAESLDCLQHAGSGPAKRHGGISPSIDVAADARHGPHHILDRVGAASAGALPEGQAIDGQHLVEPLEDAGGNAGRFLIGPASQIARSGRSVLSASSSSHGIWQRWIGVWAAQCDRASGQAAAYLSTPGVAAGGRYDE